MYFQVHQPRRLSHLGFFDIGSDVGFFDDKLNEKIVRRVADNCYQPTNLMLLKLIDKYPQARITFSISGVALEQLVRYAPEVIDSFRALATTGCVEFLGETYFHSLASLTDEREFGNQVEQHRQAMKEVFGAVPVVFRNTELIYSNDIGRMVKNLGFRGIYVEGVDGITRASDPSLLLRHQDRNGLAIFLRNFRLSDDISFRYADTTWNNWPLTSKRYLEWIHQVSGAGRIVNIGMDYETFGEHNKSAAGILRFLRQVIEGVVKSGECRMVTPSEALSLLRAQETLSVPEPISWADRQKDVSAWLGNDLQKDAFKSLNAVGKKVQALDDEELLGCWRYLQTSDHFYYMSTKTGDDGYVHNYFSPYASPYEAFINYMNALAHLESLCTSRRKSSIRAKVTRVITAVRA